MLTYPHLPCVFLFLPFGLLNISDHLFSPYDVVIKKKFFPQTRQHTHTHVYIYIYIYIYIYLFIYLFIYIFIYLYLYLTYQFNKWLCFCRVSINERHRRKRTRRVDVTYSCIDCVCFVAKIALYNQRKCIEQQ